MPVRVVSRPSERREELLSFTAADSPVAWWRRGDGFVGSGVAATFVASGSDRARSLASQWREFVASATVDDAVRVPGSGLVAFGALAFDDESAATSTLIVPRVIVGQRGGVAWTTTITPVGDDEQDPAETPFGEYWPSSLGPGALSPEGYQNAVREGLAAIANGTVGKVVLARDLNGTIPADADLRRLSRALQASYPDCWNYAVDGIIGASPETLVTVSGGTVTARVLAGTASRGADADADTAAATALATSHKDQDEHQYAVQSVTTALAPHTSALAASEQPFMLKLPNVWHLATDIEATLAEAESSLDLVAALHPTAAVAGTPTTAALEVIRAIEPFDRQRYAGPVGWINAAGDGEWAIALRCAQFSAAEDTIAVVAHAGAGIVAESDPEKEMLETRVKFRPIIDAIA